MPISDEPSPSTNCEPGSAASRRPHRSGSSHGLIRPAGRSPSGHQPPDVAVVRGVAGVEPRVHLGRALDRQVAGGQLDEGARERRDHRRLERLHHRLDHRAPPVGHDHHRQPEQGRGQEVAQAAGVGVRHQRHQPVVGLGREADHPRLLAVPEADLWPSIVDFGVPVVPDEWMSATTSSAWCRYGIRRGQRRRVRVEGLHLGGQRDEARAALRVGPVGRRPAGWCRRPRRRRRRRDSR